jgi:hypothetical protein
MWRAEGAARGLSSGGRGGTIVQALDGPQVTGVPARLWNNLETIYRERLARQKEKD